jgi:hypothetical protein
LVISEAVKTRAGYWKERSVSVIAWEMTVLVGRPRLAAAAAPGPAGGGGHQWCPQWSPGARIRKVIQARNEQPTEPGICHFPKFPPPLA